MNEQDPVAAQPHVSPDSDVNDEISLLDLLIILAKYKWLILGLPLFAGIAAAIVSFYMAEIFTGTAKILPPQQSQSAAAAMLGQLGQFAGLAGGAASALGIRNPAALYVGMLKSRTIADALIDRFSLMEDYDAKRRSDARKALEKASKISAGKDGLITIEVENKNPKRAAALANAYVEELVKLTGVLAVTEAGQRRLFFERQLHQAKDNLLKAELAARGALEQGGLAMVDAQGKSMIETSAVLRARIAAKEVEINAMRTFAAEANPEFNRARQELAALREQIAKMERGDTGNRSVAATGSKEQGVRNLTLLREVKYHEVLFELLARQYEMAKIDEAKESTVIQVLDRAIEPDRRTRPKRTLIVLLSALAVGFVALLLAFVREALYRAGHNPDSTQRLAQLRRYLIGSRAD